LFTSYVQNVLFHKFPPADYIRALTIKKLKPTLNMNWFSLYDFGALVMFCFVFRAPRMLYLTLFTLKRRVLNTL